jgi:hypothetical protein
MKLPKLVIDSFRRNCQVKIGKIKAFMAAHEDFTSARFEKLQRLNTALTDQWRRMEAVWFDHPDPISNV